VNTVSDTRLLSVAEVQSETGLDYRKALLLVKAMNYLRIGQNYYVSRRNFDKFMSQDSAVEVESDL